MRNKQNLSASSKLDDAHRNSEGCKKKSMLGKTGLPLVMKISCKHDTITQMWSYEMISPKIKYSKGARVFK